MQMDISPSGGDLVSYVMKMQVQMNVLFVFSSCSKRIDYIYNETDDNM